MASGLVTIIAGLSYYLSPMTRLRLYGVILEQRLASTGPVNFLVGWHAQAKTWTEHDGQLDTPLADEHTDETSTLRVERLPGTPTENVLLVKPVEWIRSLKTSAGFSTQVIALNHPSLAPVTVMMDKQWTVLERREGGAWRIGRALEFLIPKFPKGPVRPGSSWMDHLEWSEVAGDWKFRWLAECQWTVNGYTPCYESNCVQLAYNATLTPVLLQEAYWSKGAGRDIRYSGQAHGEALYRIADQLLIANSLAYSGTVRIHIPHLEDVPEELRVGNLPATSEGEVVLRFDDKIDVRLP